MIYEGIDPITGRERRRWHPAGTDREQAKELATALAAAQSQRIDGRRVGPTFGVYLTMKWLPAKQLTLRPSTWDGYRRLIELQCSPFRPCATSTLASPEHLDRLYATLLERGRCDGSGGLDIKTVHEVHIVIRRALRDAERRGSIVRNPAEIAHGPKRRPLTSSEFRAWNADQLRNFLDLAQSSTHFAALWLAANTGMRRGEVLGLRWGDVDLESARFSVNRSLVSVVYELHESRGKTRMARRTVDLDERTVNVLSAIRSPDSDGEAYVFCHEDASPIHPQVLSDAFRRLVAKSGLPRIRLHDLRHTHATSLLKAGVPIKVASERLGHSTPGFTMATCQHVLPGMQAEAARTFGALLERPTSSV